MAEREERSGTSAAAAAGEQVRAILEAAERSAESLEAAAREDAARIRADAEADASTTREAAERLTERADELERRLDELTEGVQTAVAGLKEDLAALRASGAEAAEAAGAQGRFWEMHDHLYENQRHLEGDDRRSYARAWPSPSATSVLGSRAMSRRAARDGSRSRRCRSGPIN